MNPVRLGFAAVTIVALLLVAERVLPLIANLLIGLVPTLAILALIFWTLRALVRRLLE